MARTAEELRERDRAYAAKSYAKHREKVKAANLAYYVANREKVAARKGVYRAAHLKEEAEANAAWRQANPERMKARAAAYYEQHAKQIRARTAAWRAANPDVVAAYKAAHRTEAAEYQAANKERKKAAQDTYYANNPDALSAKRAYNTAYRAAHANEYRNHCARRRALMLGAQVCDLTPAEWNATKELYGFRCVYCGQRPAKLTQDHIVPLSKGGNHTLANVVPACQPCNSRKNANPSQMPIQPALLV